MEVTGKNRAELECEDPVGALSSAVKAHFHRELSIASIKSRVLKDTGFNKNNEIRRDFDGISQIDWLIEKMIAEWMLDQKINY